MREFLVTVILSSGEEVLGHYFFAHSERSAKKQADYFAKKSQGSSTRYLVALSACDDAGQAWHKPAGGRWRAI